jgi:glyoxylase-like metal-dependent hydrolase (beta-lactamase superfamily II)
MDVRELRPGLWRWTARHPEWDGRVVSSAYLEAPGAVVLVDPLVPAGDEERFFAALDADVERAGAPVAVVLTNPWHRRSSAELAGRYGAQVCVAGEVQLPGGLRAHPGGMQPDDSVVHAPSHRALFTGDTLVDGRLCPEDWLSEGREHQLACLRRVLVLDADLVVPSHGEPLSVDELAKLLV